MKKSLLLYAGIAVTPVFAQTATDFTATDCASTSHTLFTELDAGKVVVMCWVMPCGACSGAASNASDVVAGMANPDVILYVLDDLGDGSCAALDGWATANGVVATATFDNAGNIIPMTDYGTPGMPKTVVVGGPSHSVYFNTNGSSWASTDLEDAINSALGLGIDDNQSTAIGLNVYPNPAVESTDITYTLAVPADVKIELFTLTGQVAGTYDFANQAAGSQKFVLSTGSFQAGAYFVRITVGEMKETVRIDIVK